MDQFLIIAFVIGLFFSGVTWVLHRFVGYRVIKYTPSLLAVVVALYQIYLARTSTGGFEDLIRGVFAVLLVYGAFFGTVTAVILEQKAKKNTNN